MRLFPFSMWKCFWVNNHFGHDVFGLEKKLRKEK